MKNISLLRL